jgi:DNA polymerase-3 subunit delta'
MIGRNEHPDMEWIRPEKQGGVIKIDQIRELQNTVYLTPKRSAFRLTILESAERMNQASANALLKILEEPPPHTVFILIAEHLATILPTVLSRCQIIPFSLSEDLNTSDLLNLGEYYPPESSQALLMQQAETIAGDLLAILEHKKHPCQVASQWANHDFSALLWLLYLLYAQLQQQFIAKNRLTGLAAESLNELEVRLSPLVVFKQLDKINTILKKISHNMNINQTLAVEDLLLSLQQVT